MSKIFQGLCAANPKQNTQVVDLIRLWIHENQRVFGDRMINNEDKDVLNGLLNDEVQTLFGLSKQEVYISDRIIFGDYMGGIDVDHRPYNLIADLKDMIKKIEGFLEDYNAGTKHPMKLIMFLDACDHVSRICRILRQPQGNALLLGVGGSGRQSLSRLASYMSNYKCF
jgi:dynein heavy chain